MAINVVANRYAKALLNICRKDNSLTKLVEQARMLEGLFAKDSKLNKLLLNPQFSRAQKLELFDKSMQKLDLLKSLANCLKLMISRSRFNVVEDFLAEIVVQYQKHVAEKTVKVITATKIDDNLKQHVMTKLQEIEKSKYRITAETDPEILGGMILLIEDKEYDFSIRGQLKQITTEIENRLQRSFA